MRRCGSLAAAQRELKLLELSENNTPVLNHARSVVQLCILLHIGAYLRPASDGGARWKAGVS